MKRVAVVLATRDEANHEYEKGRSFLRWLTSTFSKVGCEVVAVVRSGDSSVEERHPDAWLVETSTPDGALRTGIRAALDEGAEVVLVHAVERPAIRASTIDKLLKSLDGDGVVPDFDGAPGHPLVLSRAAAERLVNSGHEPQVGTVAQLLGLRRVPTRDPGVLVSIDSAEAHERLLGSRPQLAPLPKKRGKKDEGEVGEAAASEPMR